MTAVGSVGAGSVGGVAGATVEATVGFVAGVAEGASTGVGALVCVWASATVVEEETVAGSTAAGAVADAAGEGVVLSIPDCPRKGMKQVASGLRVRVVPNCGPRGW